MEIKQCIKLLELEGPISADKIKQAYKDMVNIWHPDRFPNNPRLKQKAEQKLKDINVAYTTLMNHLYTEQGDDQKQGAKEPENSKEIKTSLQKRDRTEAIVEAGTGTVLRLWSNLSSFVHRIASDVKAGMDEDAKPRPQSYTSDSEYLEKGRRRPVRGCKRRQKGGRRGRRR